MPSISHPFLSSFPLYHSITTTTKPSTSHLPNHVVPNSLPTTTIFGFNVDFLAAGSEYFPVLHSGLVSLHTNEEYHHAMVLWYYQERLQLLGEGQISAPACSSPSLSRSGSSQASSAAMSSQVWWPRIWTGANDVWPTTNDNEWDMALTSVELLPIQSSIHFPWTPVGVKLPALKYLVWE
jgi:hypothetical protein